MNQSNYMITIRYGGYQHIRSVSNITSEKEITEYRVFLQAQLIRVWESRKGRSKGAKPFVYAWKLIE